ncbi:MAG: hypothetical protein QM669_02825 [Siphonobacter sp.]
MRNIVLIFLLLGIVIKTFSQPTGSLMDPVTGKVFNSDKYSEVKGSPLLFEDWKPGNAVVAQGIYKGIELKYDVAGNTVLFKNGENAYEFQNNVLSFVLMPNKTDSSSYLIFKKGISAQDLRPDKYVQVLAEGKISLYKIYLKMESQISEINQGVVKTFIDATKYLVIRGGKSEYIKLTKKEVLGLMEPRQEIEQYTKSMKNEKDLVQLIKYYNALP